MFVINRLILQDRKEIKKLQGLLLRKGKVLVSFWKKDGLILLGLCIPRKSSILGGV